jgi:hypothetical protein
VPSQKIGAGIGSEIGAGEIPDTGETPSATGDTLRESSGLSTGSFPLAPPKPEPASPFPLLEF